MIRLKSNGNYAKATKYLENISKISNYEKLDRYAKIGVNALQSATPKDTGKTASSWSYEITEINGIVYISWLNNNINDGVNIAIILQYGHGTKSGGYVKGRDYINPALQPIFDDIEKAVWKELDK